MREVMSGAKTGPGAMALRLGLSVIEPFYAGAMAARNRLYDSGVFKTDKLPRPVLSIGNLTTGGTGKTPMVRWLAERLRDNGRHVAILSRGYRSTAAGLSDELAMLDSALNVPGRSPISLRASADRVAGGKSLLGEHPEIDTFILDDGFQHRRLHRELDIVLVSAVEPFGFEHVLPRGLLREPAAGLRRAGAIVITHSDQVDGGSLAQVDDRAHALNPTAPVYHARHAPIGFRGPESMTDSSLSQPPGQLAGRRLFAFCGIANPEGFARHISGLGINCVGSQSFRDHHAYTVADLKRLQGDATAAGADGLVTTEKDWVKIAALDGAADGTAQGLPILRLEIQIQFTGDDGNRLLAQVCKAINRTQPG